MNQLTRKAISLVERKLTKPATVLAVRSWMPQTMIEVDLHMPACDMQKWRETQHLKCKVGNFVYRDYTPTGWDAETHTCTLLIDAGHAGPGSQWARGLHEGDIIAYLGVASSHQQPEPGKQMIFLGDESSMGHFLSMEQLAGKGAAIRGYIAITEEHHQEEFVSYFRGTGLSPIKKAHPEDYTEMEQLVSGFRPQQLGDAIFYLAGNSAAMVRIRKTLRGIGFSGSQIRAQGFWN